MLIIKKKKHKTSIFKIPDAMINGYVFIDFIDIIGTPLLLIIFNAHDKSVITSRKFILCSKLAKYDCFNSFS